MRKERCQLCDGTDLRPYEDRMKCNDCDSEQPIAHKELNLNQIEHYDSILVTKDGKWLLHNKTMRTTVILKFVETATDEELEERE